MAAKLGSGDVSFRLGAATPAKVYLGSADVWSAVTVPGAPTIVSAEWDGLQTVVAWHAPASDGGSEIYEYRYYADGSAVYDDMYFWTSYPKEAYFGANLTGAELQVSAVNAIGEGPKSAPFTVTVA